MSRKIKVSPDVCKSCCYRQGFGSQPGREQKEKGVNQNIACNYLAINGHSRIFKDGKMAYPPHLCDKYLEGPEIFHVWTSDSMTEWRQKDERERLWKEMERCQY